MGSRRVVVVSPIVPFPPVGGGHKRSLRLFEAIERAGGRPHLLVGDPDEAAGVEALRQRGWDVEVVAEPPATARGRIGQQLRRLPSPYVPELTRRLERLVAEGCAFVQVEHTQCAYYTRALRTTPWVLSLHNVDSEMMRSVARAEPVGTAPWLRAWNRWHTLRTVERRAVPRASAVLCVSDDDRRLLDPLAREVVVATNGVDDEFFEIPQGLPGGERVVFFGRFDYLPNRQGIDRFLRDGWPALLAERPDALLRLVGGGMDDELADLARASPGVEAIGFADDLVAEVAAARAIVVPIWAGGGTRLKVLESLAAARPVAGTALGVGGLGFVPGTHGLVEESPVELAGATASLLADADLSLRVSAAGRQLATDYRWDAATAPACALYQRLLAAAA